MAVRRNKPYPFPLVWGTQLDRGLKTTVSYYYPIILQCQ